MSIFRVSDYTGQKTNNTKYMSKTKLPTDKKSKPHKCSQCQRKDAKRLKFGNEVRWLCIVCIKQLNRKNDKEKVTFVKASQLGEGQFE